MLTASERAWVQAVLADKPYDHKAEGKRELTLFAVPQGNQWARDDMQAYFAWRAKNKVRD